MKQEDSIEAQRRVLKDGKNMVLDESTRRLVATEEDQEHLNLLKIERVRGNSSLQETQKPKVKTKFGHRISKNLFTACHAEEVQDDLDKPRITVYKKIGEFTKIPFLSKTIQRNHSFQQFTCDMY